MAGWKTICATMGYLRKKELQTIFPEHDSDGQVVVPTIGFRTQVLNVFDRRYQVGMPVFRLAPISDGHSHCFSPDVVVPHMSADT